MTRKRAICTLFDALGMLLFLAVMYLYVFALLSIACGGSPCSLE